MKESRTPPIIYNLFPRLAGPFRSWGSHLKRAADIGFNWIFVNPIQECGVSGSMYAIKDYYRIDSRYPDPNSGMSAEEELKQVIAQAHGLGLRVMFDLVINHTAFDSVLVEANPGWYQQDSRGKLIHPSAPDTGEVWGDLAVIDNENAADRSGLWGYWEDLVAHYLSLGLDGFRCDAAYQVPVPLWRRILQRARSIRPDTKFFAETLGCDFRLVAELARAGFDYNFNSSKWWNFQDAWALQQYEQNRTQGSPSISFPDSHDTTRLAADLSCDIPAVKMRYLFAAVFSTGLMMTLGFEYCFLKTLNVVESRPEDWEPVRCDMTGFVRAANSLKLRHRVFREEGPMDLVETVNPRILVLKKATVDEREHALIMINTDREERQRAVVEDLRSLLGSAGAIRDISLEQRMPVVPDRFEDYLPPSQAVILYGEP
jgi:starch synthase (maltosyl-transferring)